MVSSKEGYFIGMWWKNDNFLFYLFNFCFGFWHLTFFVQRQTDAPNGRASPPFCLVVFLLWCYATLLLTLCVAEEVISARVKAQLNHVVVPKLNCPILVWLVQMSIATFDDTATGYLKLTF